MVRADMMEWRFLVTGTPSQEVRRTNLLSFIVAHDGYYVIDGRYKIIWPSQIVFSASFLPSLLPGFSVSSGRVEDFILASRFKLSAQLGKLVVRGGAVPSISDVVQDFERYKVIPVKGEMGGIKVNARAREKGKVLITDVFGDQKSILSYIVSLTSGIGRPFLSHAEESVSAESASLEVFVESVANARSSPFSVQKEKVLGADSLPLRSQEENDLRAKEKSVLVQVTQSVLGKESNYVVDVADLIISKGIPFNTEVVSLAVGVTHPFLSHAIELSSGILAPGKASPDYLLSGLGKIPKADEIFGLVGISIDRLQGLVEKEISSFNTSANKAKASYLELDKAVSRIVDRSEIVFDGYFSDRYAAEYEAIPPSVYLLADSIDEYVAENDCFTFGNVVKKYLYAEQHLPILADFLNQDLFADSIEGLVAFYINKDHEAHVFLPYVLGGRMVPTREGILVDPYVLMEYVSRDIEAVVEEEHKKADRLYQIMYGNRPERSIAASNGREIDADHHGWVLGENGEIEADVTSSLGAVNGREIIASNDSSIAAEFGKEVLADNDLILGAGKANVYLETDVQKVESANLRIKEIEKVLNSSGVIGSNIENVIHTAVENPSQADLSVSSRVAEVFEGSTAVKDGVEVDASLEVDVVAGDGTIREAEVQNPALAGESERVLDVSLSSPVKADKESAELLSQIEGGVVADNGNRRSADFADEALAVTEGVIEAKIEEEVLSERKNVVDTKVLDERKASYYEKDFDVSVQKDVRAERRNELDADVDNTLNAGRVDFELSTDVTDGVSGDRAEDEFEVEKTSELLSKRHFEEHEANSHDSISSIVVDRELDTTHNDKFPEADKVDQEFDSSVHDSISSLRKDEIHDSEVYGSPLADRKESEFDSSLIESEISSRVEEELDSDKVDQINATYRERELGSETHNPLDSNLVPNEHDVLEHTPSLARRVESELSTIEHDPVLAEREVRDLDAVNHSPINLNLIPKELGSDSHCGVLSEYIPKELGVDVHEDSLASTNNLLNTVVSEAPLGERVPLELSSVIVVPPLGKRDRVLLGIHEPGVLGSRKEKVSAGIVHVVSFGTRELKIVDSVSPTIYLPASIDGIFEAEHEDLKGGNRIIVYSISEAAELLNAIRPSADYEALNLCETLLAIEKEGNPPFSPEPETKKRIWLMMGKPYTWSLWPWRKTR